MDRFLLLSERKDILVLIHKITTVSDLENVILASVSSVYKTILDSGGSSGFKRRASFSGVLENPGYLVERRRDKKEGLCALQVVRVGFDFFPGVSVGRRLRAPWIWMRDARPTDVVL